MTSSSIDGGGGDKESSSSTRPAAKLPLTPSLRPSSKTAIGTNHPRRPRAATEDSVNNSSSPQSVFEEVQDCLAQSLLIFLYADLRLLSATGRINTKFEALCIDSDEAPRMTAAELAGLPTGPMDGSEASEVSFDRDLPQDIGGRQRRQRDNGISPAQIMAVLICELRREVQAQRARQKQIHDIRRQQGLITAWKEENSEDRHIVEEESLLSRLVDPKGRREMEDDMHDLLIAYNDMIGEDLVKGGGPEGTGPGGIGTSIHPNKESGGGRQGKGKQTKGKRKEEQEQEQEQQDRKKREKSQPARTDSQQKPKRMLANDEESKRNLQQLESRSNDDGDGGNEQPEQPLHDGAKARRDGEEKEEVVEVSLEPTPLDAQGVEPDRDTKEEMEASLVANPTPTTSTPSDVLSRHRAAMRENWENLRVAIEAARGEPRLARRRLLHISSSTNVTSTMQNQTFEQVGDALFEMGIQPSDSIRDDNDENDAVDELPREMTEKEVLDRMQEATESRSYGKLDFMRKFFKPNSLSQLMARSKARVVWMNDWYPIKDCIYAITVDHAKRVAMVVFRGAVTRADWGHAFDYHFKKVPNPVSEEFEGKSQHIKLHRGFQSYLFRERKDTGTRKYDEIATILHRYGRKIGPDYRVVVTGHSLGGALATLFAFYASTEERFTLNGPITLLFFGSPYVGGYAFADSFRHQERVGKIRAARFHNTRDFVTHCPPNVKKSKKGSRFQHVGIHVKLFVVPRYFRYIRTKKPSVFYVHEEGYYAAYFRAIRNNCIFHLPLPWRFRQVHTLDQHLKRIVHGKKLCEKKNKDHLLNKTLEEIYDVLVLPRYKG